MATMKMKKASEIIRLPIAKQLLTVAADSGTEPKTADEKKHRDDDKPIAIS
jgi:hypothetical protein